MINYTEKESDFLDIKEVFFVFEMLVSIFDLIHWRLRDYLRIIRGFEMMLMSLKDLLEVNSNVEVRDY